MILITYREKDLWTEPGEANEATRRVADEHRANREEREACAARTFADRLADMTPDQIDALGAEMTSCITPTAAAPPPAAPAASAPSDLTDSEWTLLRGFFPPKSSRKNARDWRRVLDAALYLKVSGTRWSCLPRRYGNPAAVRKAMEHGGTTGLWVTLLEKIDGGELSAIAPEQLRRLRSIATEWSRKGESYARQRT